MFKDINSTLTKKIHPYRKRLFTETVSANKKLFTETVSANKKLFTETVSANKKLFTETGVPIGIGYRNRNRSTIWWFL